jgi:hypothetical protein
MSTLIHIDIDPWAWGDTAMTLEYLAAEIAILPRQQDTQKAHWLRWGMAANVAGAILFAVVMFKVAMFKVAMTGEDPPIAMIVIALIVSFMGAGFTTVGRLLALSR